MASRRLSDALPSMVFKLLKTEKTDALRQFNTVAFIVPLSMNKLQIRQYLQEIYGLNVLKVNTSIQYGKVQRTRYALNKLPTVNKRKDVKKAYVRLDPADFEGFEDTITAESLAASN